jgi:hypothetical protein
MRDAATVARYAEKAYAHIGAILQGRTLPFTLDLGEFEATVLTLAVNAQGDLVATLTWKHNGVPQAKPDGDVQTWVVTNPPVNIADVRGDIKVGAGRYRRDPLAVAQRELRNLLQFWSTL